MLEKMGGVSGVVGLLAMLAGVALIADVNLQVAGGLALVVAGLGLFARGMIRSVLSSLGMGGMF